MRTPIASAIILSVMLVAGSAIKGQETGAKTSGNWNDSSIWTLGTVPGPGNDVYIGGHYPPGANWGTTVTLTEDESARTIRLGNGIGLPGVIDLGGNKLTVGSSILIGDTQGTGTIIHSGGYFTAPSLFLTNGNSLNFEASDQLANLYIQSGSIATTSTTANVTSNVHINGASTLNLGSNLKLNNTLDIQENGSSIHMNGYNISSKDIYLSQLSDAAVTIDRGITPGLITAERLFVSHQAFELLPDDDVAAFYLTDASSTFQNGVELPYIQVLDGSTATTTTSSNLSGSVYVKSNSNLFLGDDLNLSGTLSVEDNGTLNGTYVRMNGHNVAANSIYLNWDSGYSTATVDRGDSPGSLTTTNLYVRNATFDILPIDHITNFNLLNTTTTLHDGIAISELKLGGGDATTTSVENITKNITVYDSGTLNLGADLQLTGGIALRAASTLHMNGHDIHTPSFQVAWTGSIGGSITLDRGTTPGSLFTDFFQIKAYEFDFLAGDQVTKSLYVFSGSEVRLAKSLNLSNDLYVEETGSKLKMNGHDISANSIYLGWVFGESVTLDRGATPGSLTANNLYFGNGTLTLLSTDHVNNLFLTNAAYTAVIPNNVSNSVTVKGGSTLNLTQDLELTGVLDIEGRNSTVNANGFDISADQLIMGNGKNVAVNNLGMIYLNGLQLLDTTLMIHGGVIEDLISYSGNLSTLTIVETNGTGLTFNGEFQGLSGHIYMLNMIITQPGWAFRWQNDSPGSNHVTELENLIASAQIGLLVTPGIDYHVYDQGGYTYIGTTPVPEASSLALAGVICAGCLAARVLQQRSRRAKLHAPS